MRLLVFFIGTAILIGCDTKPAGLVAPGGSPPKQPKAQTVFPEPGPAKSITGGVKRHEVKLVRDGVPMTIWAYLPANKTEGKLPCIFIAPAGSRMVHGMPLEEGDSKEHIPFAEAGFAVVAYTMDGAIRDEDFNNNNLVTAAVRAYKNSGAGLENARTAIDYALAKLPVDPNRLAMSGHSSAATHALYVARVDPRIKACISFAPCIDVQKWIAPLMPTLKPAFPDYPAFIEGTSPKQHTEGPTCPVFLFNAKDDEVIKFKDVSDYAAELTKVNPKVKFVDGGRGGHYDPMVERGIPAAIDWLRLEWRVKSGE